MNIQQKTAIAAVSVVTLFFTYLFIEPMIFGYDKPISAEDSHYSDAALSARGFVKQRLKSPSTAEFPPTSTATVKKTPNGTFVVSSYVDSQNAFGATLRSSWVAEIRYLSGNKVELVDIQFID